MSEGAYQNEINILPKLPTTRYENIFKLYQTTNSQYFYNIINSIQFPTDVNPSVYYEITVSNKMPWTMISFNEYETMDLWWLICVTNNIENPVLLAEPGLKLKIIRKEFLKFIFDEINIKLKSL